MPLKLFNTDILNQPSGLIILPIDGIAAGHEGALGRNFIKLYPENWQIISQKMKYPLPLGKTECIDCTQAEGFQYVMMASMLNHTESLSRTDYKSIAYTITRYAVSFAVNNNIRRVATVLLSGGWRLSIDEAFLAMIDGYEKVNSSHKFVDFEIFELDNDKFTRIKRLAETMGFEVGG